MRKIESILKDRRNIVFFDLEGTQRTAEMIAIGAISVSLNKDGTIKNRKPPFKRYVRSIDKVGDFVTKLTGITDQKLRKEGVSFTEAMEAFKKYCGLSFKKSIFVTFGKNDLRILQQTIAHNIKYPVEICNQIKKNYWDFGGFIESYVKDDKGNQMSLVHYCELFNLDLVGPAHDPENDAINLANLYDAFIKNPETVMHEYKKVLLTSGRFPTPVLALLRRIKEGESVDINDLEKEILKDLK